MGAVILASDEGGFGMEQAVAAFRKGGSRLDCIEQGIRAVEDDPRALTVGYGGAPNAEGVVELDASLMDGENRLCGAVGALTGTKNPISVARNVMERLPHVFLTGKGAARFSREIEAEPHEMYHPSAQANFNAWAARQGMTQQELTTKPLTPLMDFKPRSNLSLGTVTMIVRDRQGKFAGGVSTSGWAYKYPGRIGDSPIVGAGLYVDSRHGAATCTHTGEMTIRASTAHSVVMHMRYGKSVKEACELAAEDLLSLAGGYLGPVIIHALDKGGEPYVLRLGETQGDNYWLWKETEGKICREKAVRHP